MRRIAFHPLLFAVSPALSLYLSNVDTLAFRQVFPTLVALAAGALLLWLALHALVRSRERAAILASAALILFFSYGAVFQMLLETGVRPGTLHALRSIAPFLLIGLFAALALLVLRSRSPMPSVTILLNVSSLVLAVPLLSMTLLSLADARRARQTADWELARLAAELQPDGYRAGDLPDIYYIVVDGFARADVLRGVYDLDISGFLSFLKSRGFFVASRSRANYAQTTLSLASSLNFSYLDRLAGAMGGESKDRLPLAAMIDHNLAFDALRASGYRIATFSSSYQLADIRSADVDLSLRGGLNAFQVELLNQTPIPSLSRGRLVSTSYDLHRERIEHVFDHLAELAPDPAPTLTFAHILAPHAPFVFGPGGKPIEPPWSRTLGNFTLADGPHLLATMDRREYVESYRSQLVYVTGRLEQAIDEILARSPQPPIILLQSDHGPGSTLDWANPQPEGLNERLSILNAYHFPGADPTSFYPDLSPVNSFRLLFNQYFGTHYPLLQDRTFFSTWERPYDFREVPAD